MISIAMTFHEWHKTKRGLLCFALIELVAAYGLASFAINNGSLWYYLLTLIFLVGALQNFLKFVRKVIQNLHV